jgi:hypothetical protein
MEDDFHLFSLSAQSSRVGNKSHVSSREVKILGSRTLRIELQLTEFHRGSFSKSRDHTRAQAGLFDPQLFPNPRKIALDTLMLFSRVLEAIWNQSKMSTVNIFY